MKTAWENTLMFISAGTACSQDQDGVFQIGQDKFGLGRSPGNSPVHSFWVGGRFQIRTWFHMPCISFTHEHTLTSNTHTQNIPQKIHFLSVNMKMFSLWKPPIGWPQKFSSNWETSWQILWTINHKTSQRRLKDFRAEIERGIRVGGAIEG